MKERRGRSTLTTAWLKGTGAAPVCAVLLLAFVCLGMLSCGEQSATVDTKDNAGLTVAQPTDYGYRRSASGYVVGDDDQDQSYYDDRRIRGYGTAAAVVDARAIARAIRNYYAAALAGDGTLACSLVDVRLARGTYMASAIPRDYASPAARALRGHSCPEFMTKLFALSHAELALADPRTMKVTTVRVNLARTHGLAVLTFMSVPERQVAVHREGGKWKLDSLLDEEIP